MFERWRITLLQTDSARSHQRNSLAGGGHHQEFPFLIGGGNRQFLHEFFSIMAHGAVQSLERIHGNLLSDNRLQMPLSIPMLNHCHFLPGFSQSRTNSRSRCRARSVSPPAWLACIRHAMRLMSHARFPDRVSSPQTSANFARSSLSVIRCRLSTNNTNSHE